MPKIYELELERAEPFVSLAGRLGGKSGCLKRELSQKEKAFLGYRLVEMV